MTKVAATETEIPAIEELAARGVDINFTLLFSLARYEQLIDAYVAGLERRVSAGALRPGDSRPPRPSPPASTPTPMHCCRPAQTCASVAIANAQLACARYRERFTDESWLPLHDLGAHPQRAK
jgi:transaldolase